MLIMNIKKSTLTSVAAVLSFLCLSMTGFAEEVLTTYGGDPLTRSTLTWGEARNDLAKKGVTFDLSLTQVGQGNISGGRKIGWEYGGRGDLTLNIDTQKLGWWPGGFITVEVEGNFGNSVNSYTGALMSVNTNQIFPMSVGDQLNIPNVSFMQFFSHYVGVFVGKLDTMSGDANEFAHGKGDVQFFNLAFSINPVALMTPYSTLGAGVVILPTKDPKEALITLNVLNADGQANSAGFDELFKGNTIYAIEGRVKTDFFGMTGHQLVGATYNTKNFSSIDQSLRIILENRAIQQKNDTWCFYYNFDQYLYEPKKGSGKGIGLFGRFGASDGNPNPSHYFYSLGVGGRGVIPGRPLDQFGIGYYYIDVSNPKFTGPLQTRTALRDEQGLEAYYNFAVTPWMKLTPDIQVIRGAQKQAITTEFTQVGPVQIPTVSRKDIDTATVLGLRLQVVF